MAVAGTLTYKTDVDQSGIQKGMQKTGSIIKGVIAGLGIAKVVSTAMNSIKESIDGAVERVDTLNNFPKVMKNLGISAEASEKSIKKMSDKLAGLPTTLNDGAMAVQRFTSANGNVEKSTDIFLALNNAILAGGASTEIQASALEQLSQAYAKGKPDMMEWRTAMTAMPAQLRQVATAMGYVSTDELGEALRKGEVSMDEFMDKVVELNEKGVEGFASFEEQARNSVSGIKTALTVAKTQVVKGVADIIKALDVKLDKLGLGSLSQVIQKIGVDSKKALDFIAELISGDTEKILKDLSDKLKTKAPEVIESFGEGIVERVPTIVENFGTILTNVFEILSANLPAIIEFGANLISTLVSSISEQLPTLIPVAVQTVMTYINSLLDNAPKMIDAGISLVKSLIQGIINALPLFVEQAPKLVAKGVDIVLYLIQGILKELPNLIAQIPYIISQLVLALTDPQMILKIKSVGPVLMIALAKALIENIPNMLLAVPRLITELYKGFRDRIANTNWKELGSTIVKTIWQGILDLLQWFKDLILGWWKSAKDFLGSHIHVNDIGKNIVKGIWEGIKSMAGWFKDRITGWVGDATSFIKKMFRIGSPSKLMADEVGQWLPKGIAVGITANTDSVTNSLDEMYKEMDTAIKDENSKLSLNSTTGDVYNRTIYQIPDIVNENKLLLDGDVIYENQEKVSARKSLQTQFGGAYSVSN